MTVGETVCTGVGQNKKLAKRVAAEQMLVMLGYSLTPPLPPQPAKPALKPSTENLTGPAAAAAAAVIATATGADKHVTFAERESGAGMQNVIYNGRFFGKKNLVVLMLNEEFDSSLLELLVAWHGVAD